MRAAIAYPGDRDLCLDDVPDPVVRAGDVVVRVVSAGVTPGLLKWWALGRMPFLPAPIGHEIAGLVAEVGDGVSAVDVGDRVRVHANLTCLHCEACLDDREQMCDSCAMLGAGTFGPDSATWFERYPGGGLAEYVLVPAWLLDPVPPTVGFDVAAKVHDLASCLRALKLADMRPGATLAVTAATGAMGAGMARLAGVAGVGMLVVVGRSRERAEGVAALAEVPTAVVALEELDGWESSAGLTAALRAIVPGGLDAVIDFLTEPPGLEQTVAALRVGGTAVTMAPNRAPLGITALDLMHRCLRLVGTRNGTRGDARQVLALLASGRVSADALITHRFPLEQVNEALAVLRERPLPTWMCVVNPTTEPAR